MAGDFSIARHDPRDDTPQEIAERVEIGNILTAEVLPDEPPTPLEQAIAAHEATPARIRRWSFRARDSAGSLVATAGTRVDPEHDDNPDVFQVSVHVLPSHRRQGLGTRLLAELVALAREEGRSRFITETHEPVPGGEAFARKVGAEPKLAEHLNHLPLAEVDRPMLERWAAEGPTRASDYELFGFDGPVPDDILEDFVDLVLVMNTAPRDDLEMQDFTLTPEQVREMERQQAAVGEERWTLVARHLPSGELAGFHDLVWNPTNPEVMWVWSTGVRPKHRGHALGKWLKAALTLRVLDERPGVTEIRTGNADSNDAMLGINQLMGYRPMISATVWELPVAQAESWLASR
jgi:GNAT superfamily N-acetyltransferase